MRKDLTTPPMENNELHPNWKKEANDRINPDIKENSLGKAINNGKKQSFIQGATLMRDRVEKMLKDKRAILAQEYILATDGLVRMPKKAISISDKIVFIDNLLIDLKNITPND